MNTTTPCKPRWPGARRRAPTTLRIPTTAATPTATAATRTATAVTTATRMLMARASGSASTVEADAGAGAGRLGIHGGADPLVRGRRPRRPADFSVAAAGRGRPARTRLSAPPTPRCLPEFQIRLPFHQPQQVQAHLASVIVAPHR